MSEKWKHTLVDLDDPSLTAEQLNFLTWLVEKRSELEMLATLAYGSKELTSLDGQITATDRAIGRYWGTIRGFHNTRPSQFANLV